MWIPSEYAWIEGRRKMKRWLVILATMGAWAPTILQRTSCANRRATTPNWLMYGKKYSEWRYSGARQINTATVKDSRRNGSFRRGTLGKLESTPLVSTEMVWTGPPITHRVGSGNGGRVDYAKPLPQGVSICCGPGDRVSRRWKQAFQRNPNPSWWRWMPRPRNLCGKPRSTTSRKGYSARLTPLIVPKIWW